MKSKIQIKKSQQCIFLIILFIVWILDFGFGILHADTGTTIDPSRTIYAGRTLGLGGAGMALIADGEGLFLNPSGLSKLNFPAATVLSRKLFLEETTYSLISAAFPTAWGTFGVAYTGAAVGGSFPTSRDPGTGRIIVNPSLEAVGYESSVLIITYARELPWQKVSVGGNLKFFNQSIVGAGELARGTGMGLDLSAQYRPLHYMTAAINLQNILGGSLNWSGASERLGGFNKLGVAVNVLGTTAEALYKYSSPLVACLDLDIPRNVLQSGTLFHLGLEWVPIKDIILRTGLNQEQGGTGLTFGVGFKNTAFRFDYAYAPRPGIAGDSPHYFSMSYVGDRVIDTFLTPKKQKISAIRFISPKDRTITESRSLPLIFTARYSEIYDQKTVWTVPVVSSTFEVREVSKLADLIDVRVGGYPVKTAAGSVETFADLNIGRNVIRVTGLATPEYTNIAAEARILRVTPYVDATLEYWAAEPIYLSSTLGLIKGYPDMTFRPDKGITRAELTALLVRTSTVDPSRWAIVDQEEKFKDVKAGLWYKPFVNMGVDLGYVEGYPDKTFKPNKTLSRAEGITVLARFANLPEESGQPFPDLKPDFWANKHIAAAKKIGMLQYLEGKNFEHNRSFTRAEAAEVLYRVPSIQRKVDDFWNLGKIPAEVSPPATSEAR